MKTKNITIEQGEAVNISQFPNFHKSGNITGMRRYYGANALLVRCGNYIYNVTEAPEIYAMAY